LTETRDEWLARLDQFLEIAAPAEQIIEGGFEFYTAVPHFPLVEVRPAALRELLESHGLTPPDAYRGLVELHPAELGADSEARYILADARDPLAKWTKLPEPELPAGVTQEQIDRLQQAIARSALDHLDRQIASILSPPYPSAWRWPGEPSEWPGDSLPLTHWPSCPSTATLPVSSTPASPSPATDPQGG
jgi:hypothetical protein